MKRLICVVNVKVESQSGHGQVKVNFHKRSQLCLGHKMSQSDEECRMRFRIYHVQDMRI